MPDKKERDLWWAFLAGRPESEWNPPKKPKQPKLSRWQQHNMKRAAREFGDELRDAPLPYDLKEPAQEEYGGMHPFTSSGTASVDRDGYSNSPQNYAVPVNPMPTPADDLLVSEDAADAFVCTPREPTPFLLQHIDHVSRQHFIRA